MCDCAAFEFACVCMSKLAPGPYWYLECDWQRRSLLGEIVNRVEPVICSRQPWKGKADSQGSYWGFQRCCMSDLGPGPSRTDPASRAFFFFFSLKSALINVLSHSFFRYPGFFSASFFCFPDSVSITTRSFNHFKPLFVSTLQSGRFCQSAAQVASLPLFCVFFSQHTRNFAYIRHNLILTISTFIPASPKANKLSWFAYSLLSLLVLSVWIFYIPFLFMLLVSISRRAPSTPIHFFDYKYSLCIFFPPHG